MKYLSILILISLLSAGESATLSNPFISDTTSTYIVADTLVMTTQDNPQYHLRWAGLGLMLAGGISTYLCHQAADNSYHEYQSSGSISEMNDLYDRTLLFDRLVAAGILTTEIGLYLIYKSFRDE